MDTKVTQQIPVHLASIYHVITCAFPSGIEAEAYFPLLAILYEHMSHRGIAELFGLYFGKDPMCFLNDVYRVATTDSPSPEAVLRVKQRLLGCGYQAWLDED